MSSVNGRSRRAAVSPSSLDELAQQIWPRLEAFNSRVSWILQAQVPEEDLRQYIQDPIEALPPRAAELLPQLGLVLVPYLHRTDAHSPVSIVSAKPDGSSIVYAVTVPMGERAVVFLAVEGEQVADYHYELYDELSASLAARLPAELEAKWDSILREELSAEIHGEVDERSWAQKQSLLRRPARSRGEGKPFRTYAREAFRDTMTLFMHGICCDIDVETGPRQLPSRYLRKRLEALKEMLPPPEGHAVFPEDLQPR